VCRGSECRAPFSGQFLGEPGPDIIAFAHGSAWRVWSLEACGPNLADELVAWLREVHARMPSDERWHELLNAPRNAPRLWTTIFPGVHT
jgi:hypothetical protein